MELNIKNKGKIYI